MSEKRYWHCYGGVTEDFGGSWALITVESTLPGDEMPKELTNGFPYLASFDHEPTDSEKDALAPYRYRDDQEAAR